MEKYIFETENFGIKLMDNVLDGFEIRDIRVKYKANDHTKLLLKFENLKEARIYEGYLNEKKPKIQVILTKNNENMSFFTGKIEEMNIGAYGVDGHIVDIEAYSSTKEMDREKKFRVYQNINLTIKDIITDIMEEYKNIGFVINEKIKSTKIGKPIVQYNETDWEFIKRVASHAGAAIYPKGVDAFIIGTSVGTHQEKKINVGQNYWTKTKNIYEEYKYKLYSNNVAICGDEVHLETEDKILDLVASEGEVWLENGITNSEIIFYDQRYQYEYIANEKIAGKVIEGRVLEVLSEKEIAKMRVDLSEGLRKSAEIVYGKKYMKKKAYSDKENVFKYPYITPYSQTNTGLFCTPEKGDIVAVYFPTEEEIESYVMGSVNSKGNGRFSDPTKRNYTISLNDKNEFNLVIDINSLLIEDNTMNFIGKNNIGLNSEENIGIYSGENIQLKSKENMEISSKDMIINHKNKLEIGENTRFKGAKNTMEFGTVFIRGVVKSTKGV